MDNQRSSPSHVRLTRTRIGSTFAVAIFLLVFPNFTGAISAFGTGIVGFRHYIDGGLSSSMNNLYPGTNCEIYSNALTVTDVLPSIFDMWAERYARSYNTKLHWLFTGSITTKCGALVDPDADIYPPSGMDVAPAR